MSRPKNLCMSFLDRNMSVVFTTIQVKITHESFSMMSLHKYYNSKLYVITK